jgi:hypothetical protein
MGIERVTALSFNSSLENAQHPDSRTASLSAQNAQSIFKRIRANEVKPCTTAFKRPSTSETIVDIIKLSEKLKDSSVTNKEVTI